MTSCLIIYLHATHPPFSTEVLWKQQRLQVSLTWYQRMYELYEEILYLVWPVTLAFSMVLKWEEKETIPQQQKIHEMNHVCTHLTTT
jgi:hypothetical protein